MAQVWREQGVKRGFRFLYSRMVEHISRHTLRQRAYQEWILRNRLTLQDVQFLEKELEKWDIHPIFSIILPVYNVEVAWLEKAIISVQNQIYPHWELCIADDASIHPKIKLLLTHYSELDSRIKVIFRDNNGHISAASNSALELATGDYVALLDHDDELAINALYENAKLINQHPEADFIYSDEDKIDSKGRRLDPFFKPDWSPDYFHACMYTCHLGVYRTSLIRKVGGFRSGYDGAQDYDLVLRVVEQTKNIYHIPKILYHWRIIPASAASGETAKPWAYDAAQCALEDMLARSPYPGRVERLSHAGFYRVRRDIIGLPLVSIVIPSQGFSLKTKKGTEYSLKKCIHSICDRSTYQNFEIVLVEGPEISDSILENITDCNLKVVKCSDPFNLAQRINLGAAQAKGDFLVLLNENLEVITQDWLESMLEFAQQAEIGSVGAKLFFPNGTIQHVGIVVLGNHLSYPFQNFWGDHSGYFFSNLVNRNYLAVSADCLMMRRELFFDLGGMDKSFPRSYQNVDLCLKAHHAGYRNVVTPYAQLDHCAPIPHQTNWMLKEGKNLNEQWESHLRLLNCRDPYYNPNFPPSGRCFEL